MDIINILKNGGDEKKYKNALKQLSLVPERQEKVEMDSADQLYVPENMKEIFEISNKNRKKNKLRKKDT